MTTAEVLIRAKEELVTRGWCQGGYENRQTGEVCVAGAINLATTGAVENTHLGVFGFWRAFMRGTGYPTSGVPGWNDCPGRTPEQVLATFDAAIAIALQQERGSAETTDLHTTTSDVRGTAVVGR